MNVKFYLSNNIYAKRNLYIPVKVSLNRGTIKEYPLFKILNFLDETLISDSDKIYSLLDRNHPVDYLFKPYVSPFMNSDSRNSNVFSLNDKFAHDESSHDEVGRRYSLVAESTDLSDEDDSWLSRDEKKESLNKPLLMHLSSLDDSWFSKSVNLKFNDKSADIKRGLIFFNFIKKILDFDYDSSTIEPRLSALDYFDLFFMNTPDEIIDAYLNLRDKDMRANQSGKDLLMNIEYITQEFIDGLKNYVRETRNKLVNAYKQRSSTQQAHLSPWIRVYDGVEMKYVLNPYDSKYYVMIESGVNAIGLFRRHMEGSKHLSTSINIRFINKKSNRDIIAPLKVHKYRTEKGTTVGLEKSIVDIKLKLCIFLSAMEAVRNASPSNQMKEKVPDYLTSIYNKLSGMQKDIIFNRFLAINDEERRQYNSISVIDIVNKAKKATSHDVPDKFIDRTSFVSKDDFIIVPQILWNERHEEKIGEQIREMIIKHFTPYSALILTAFPSYVNEKGLAKMESSANMPFTYDIGKNPSQSVQRALDFENDITGKSFDEYESEQIAKALEREKKSKSSKKRKSDSSERFSDSENDESLSENFLFKEHKRLLRKNKSHKIYFLNENHEYRSSVHELQETGLEEIKQILENSFNTDGKILLGLANQVIEKKDKDEYNKLKASLYDNFKKMFGYTNSFEVDDFVNANSQWLNSVSLIINFANLLKDSRIDMKLINEVNPVYIPNAELKFNEYIFEITSKFNKNFRIIFETSFIKPGHNVSYKVKDVDIGSFRLYLVDRNYKIVDFSKYVHFVSKNDKGIFVVKIRGPLKLSRIESTTKGITKSQKKNEKNMDINEPAKTFEELRGKLRESILSKGALYIKFMFLFLLWAFVITYETLPLSSDEDESYSGAEANEKIRNLMNMNREIQRYQSDEKNYLSDV